MFGWEGRICKDIRMQVCSSIQHQTNGISQISTLGTMLIHLYPLWLQVSLKNNCMGCSHVRTCIPQQWLFESNRPIKICFKKELAQQNSVGTGNSLITHRPVWPGKQVVYLQIFTSPSSSIDSIPQSHSQLCNGKPTAAFLLPSAVLCLQWIPQTVLSSPPTSYFTPAPNSSRYPLGTHRPLWPGMQVS